MQAASANGKNEPSVTTPLAQYAASHVVESSSDRFLI
jgi:hypothetical protein